MKSNKKYYFIDKAVFIPEKKILVIADIHLGFEEILNKEGILVLRTQYKKIVSDLKEIFEKTGRAKEIIILGDLKHCFGKILKQEWKDVLDFIGFLEQNLEKRGKIILIKGNHDKILEGMVRKKDIKVKDFYIKDNFLFIHGHKMHDKVLIKTIKTIFLGHLHPAISIKENAKSEKYKCFLVGKYKGKETIILPSFFPLIEGSNVLNFKNNSKFKLRTENFEVYIPVEGEDKVLGFGKVKDVGGAG